MMITPFAPRTPQRLNGLDVLRIEPAQRAAHSVNGDAVHHNERRLPRVKGCWALHAHRDAAARRARHDHSGDPARQHLFECLGVLTRRIVGPRDRG